MQTNKRESLQNIIKKLREKRQTESLAQTRKTSADSLSSPFDLFGTEHHLDLTRSPVEEGSEFLGFSPKTEEKPQARYFALETPLGAPRSTALEETEFLLNLTRSTIEEPESPTSATESERRVLSTKSDRSHLSPSSVVSRALVRDALDASQVSFTATPPKPSTPSPAKWTERLEHSTRSPYDAIKSLDPARENNLVRGLAHVALALKATDFHLKDSTFCSFNLRGSYYRASEFGLQIKQERTTEEEAFATRVFDFASSITVSGKVSEESIGLAKEITEKYSREKFKDCSAADLRKILDTYLDATKTRGR
jgi:hypothetical protein